LIELSVAFVNKQVQSQMTAEICGLLGFRLYTYAILHYFMFTLT